MILDSNLYNPLNNFNLKNDFEFKSITTLSKDQDLQLDPSLNYYIYFNNEGIITRFISIPFSLIDNNNNEITEMPTWLNNSEYIGYVKRLNITKLNNNIYSKLIKSSDKLRVLTDGDKLYPYELKVKDDKFKSIKTVELNKSDEFVFNIWSTFRENFIGGNIIITNKKYMRDKKLHDHNINMESINSKCNYCKDSIELIDNSVYDKNNPHKVKLKFNNEGTYSIKVEKQLPYSKSKLKSYFEVKVI